MPLNYEHIEPLPLSSLSISDEVLQNIKKSKLLHKSYEINLQITGRRIHIERQILMIDFYQIDKPFLCS